MKQMGEKFDKNKEESSENFKRLEENNKQTNENFKQLKEELKQINEDNFRQINERIEHTLSLIHI